MSRAAVLVYGVACYLAALAVIVYAVGFVGDLVVPRTVDVGPAAPPGEAVVVNLLLLGLFAVQHSVMARPAFKRALTRTVPPAAERSTYVLASVLAFGLLFWQWRPIPGDVWDLRGTAVGLALAVLFWAGWALAVGSTFALDHFDLFGLRQAAFAASGRVYEPPPFRVPWLYRRVRHPIMLGFILAFWAAPRMTRGHLLFASVVTAYVLVGVWLEERDLAAAHGEEYARYRRRVPALLPWPWRGGP